MWSRQLSEAACMLEVDSRPRQLYPPSPQKKCQLTVKGFGTLVIYSYRPKCHLFFERYVLHQYSSTRHIDEV